MEKERTERYAKSLERTIQNDHHYLKETVEDFREMCLMITPEKSIPHGIIVDIRETYKEIQGRLKEVRAIQQLLDGKYRQYARRDPLRDKEIKELAFLAKNCYSKFDYILMQKEAQERAKREQSLRDSSSKSFQWFRSKENQVHLLRTLRILGELDYESAPDPGMEERREIAQAKPRSLTLFVFTGEAKVLDDLQSRLKLREHDAFERYGSEEIRGVLTHLREISASEVEPMFQRFIEGKGYLKVKCLLLPIRSHKDLDGKKWDLMKKTREEMKEGEVRTVSI